MGDPHFFGKKVKVLHVYRLIARLKAHQPTVHFTSWLLDLFIRVPFQLHEANAALQLFWRIKLVVRIATSVLPGTHLHQVKHVKVHCPRTQHRNNVLLLIGGKRDISLKILHQVGFETARQAAAFAKLRALTIAPRPLHNPLLSSKNTKETISHQDVVTIQTSIKTVPCLIILIQ